MLAPELDMEVAAELWSLCQILMKFNFIEVGDAWCDILHLIDVTSCLFDLFGNAQVSFSEFSSIMLYQWVDLLLLLLERLQRIESLLYWYIFLILSPTHTLVACKSWEVLDNLWDLITVAVYLALSFGDVFYLGVIFTLLSMDFPSVPFRQFYIVVFIWRLFAKFCTLSLLFKTVKFKFFVVGETSWFIFYQQYAFFSIIESLLSFTMTCLVVYLALNFGDVS